MSDIKLSYFVYSIQTANATGAKPILGLSKEEQPPHGHSSYESAVQWINNSDKRNMDYTILAVFKTP